MKERRKHPRTKTKGLSTALGEVIDISESGIGVYCKGRVSVKVGDRLTLGLAQDGEHFEITAQVVRIDKVGMFRHDIGFCFVDVSEQTLERVRALTQSPSNAFVGPRCWVAA